MVNWILKKSRLPALALERWPWLLPALRVILSEAKNLGTRSI